MSEEKEKIINPKGFSVRGKLIQGKIIKLKSQKTAVIEIEKVKYIRKYERYQVVTKKYPVHIPDDMVVNVGDIVLCGETRKISKTKSFVILKKIEKVDKKWNKLVHIQQKD